MAWMEVLAPAKINLFLELIERRGDGFHEIETIMTRVGMYDRIYLRRRPDEQIQLIQLPAAGSRSRHPAFSMPLDESNLVWRAADLLRQHTGCDFGVDIAIQKNIPAQAGLAGGSSDAATTLMALNRLFRLNVDRRQLMVLGNQLGSDPGFFFGSPTARCTGRGEQIESVAAPFSGWLVLAMPPTGLDTAEVYRHSSIPKTGRSSGSLMKGLLAGNLRMIGSQLCNRLQIAAGKLNPWIDALKKEFMSLPCLGHQMTGSGAAWFGLFANRVGALRSSNLLMTRLPRSCYVCVCPVGNKAHSFKYGSG